MITSENISDFYKRVFRDSNYPDGSSSMQMSHFNVFSREHCPLKSPYNRKDYFKISLMIGEGQLHYADQWISIDRPALVFSSPLVPYSWETTNPNQKGWFCLFTQKFIQEDKQYNHSILENHFFHTGGSPVYFLTPDQLTLFDTIFQRMNTELRSDFRYKYEIIRNQLQLLVLEALKMKPIHEFSPYQNSSQRISYLFFELLERQFPIDTENLLRLKNATDYAQLLNIHVNSLNRALKQSTGKTTHELISMRIIQEAKALLQHSHWNINEIAYALGFEEAANFSNYFKKNTGFPPLAFRNKVV
ncbi:helix-turn-helix transcriptional regulator [Sphingobacterium sp. N143]|uniref:helix-turn-helix domain-containing protein n=1 Tax=Sphingobacterium sp. N143 TaxID=2746727 RepID=UPI002574FB8B|nr:response regulator transcription factor [Sphingobacterium sp. N143]MDM1294121.1 helix-turn-helix transcriptional regulator [Sphingobacterium sp. N143]